ncbi:hypothetical protein CFC21_056898, partial [Triticum aestivum]
TTVARSVCSAATARSPTSPRCPSLAAPVPSASPTDTRRPGPTGLTSRLATPLSNTTSTSCT